jgi:hypothetical protein
MNCRFNLTRAICCWFVIWRLSMASGSRSIRVPTKADLVAEGLKDPLLGELKDFLVQKRKIEAVKRLRDATGTDLSTAMRVLNVIGPPAR